MINFRTDPATDRALAELTADGSEKAAVIRKALIEASRQRKRDRMREDSQRLASDPQDQVAVREVQEYMAAVRAW